MYDNLKEKDWLTLIDNRFKSSDTVWSVINKTYERNLNIYKNEPAWLENVSVKKSRVRANRIFRDMESVINGLIANPPKPNIIAGRDTDESKELAIQQEKYFVEKYSELNIKEEFRKGLRNLYFGRLMVIKPFWNAKKNDFDAKALDPRKVRISKSATNTEDSEFAIEEVTDNLMSVITRFPGKEDKILAKSGLDKAKALLENPEITYQEAWIQNYTVFKYAGMILEVIKNPYWDWDGILLSEEEDDVLNDEKSTKAQRRSTLEQAREQQDERVTQEGVSLNSYYFNHFDEVRKPYIVATILNNEDSPIGQTDFITQAAPLQENVDKRKRQIDENAEIVNGIIKVDESVMSKANAQKLRFDTGGVIWGKGVANGVQRETGSPLPQFVFDDMQDSRNEIDNIMAATSAFRGEREGQETKAGRLALIEQSFLNLNELVQVVDYVSYELFNWFYQLAKIKYTEHHYAKTIGSENAVDILTLIQDDFEDGTEVRIIPGKTLPEDKQWKFEMAQADIQAGLLAPTDYFKFAGYESPAELAENRLEYDSGIALQKLQTDQASQLPLPTTQEGIGILSSNFDQAAQPQS